MMPNTNELGLFALGLVLLPGERVPLHIFEPRYRQLFADCVLEDTPFVVLYSEDETTASTGCAARFDELLERHDDGRISVVVRGLEPVEILREIDGRMYYRAECRTCTDTASTVDPTRTAQATERFAALAEHATGSAQTPEPEDGIPWSYVLASHVELPSVIKQELLETRDENARLDLVTGALEHELAGHKRAELAAEVAPTNGKVPLD
jgi:Lon protease-like protein